MAAGLSSTADEQHTEIEFKRRVPGFLHRYGGSSGDGFWLSLPCFRSASACRHAAIPWVSGRSRAAPWARAPARLLAPHRAAIRASAPLIGGVAGASLRDDVNTKCLTSPPMFATEESLQKSERSRDDPCEPPVCPARLPARRRSVRDGLPLRPDCATRPRRYQPSARRVYQPLSFRKGERGPLVVQAIVA